MCFVSMSFNSKEKQPATIGLADLKDYKLLRRIGAGTYGDVWLARDSVGKHVAVKVIDRERLALMSQKNREERALRLMRTELPEHQHLIRIHHVGNDAARLYYVMDLADNAIDEDSSSGIQGSVADGLAGSDSEENHAIAAEASGVGRIRAPNIDCYRPKTLADGASRGAPLAVPDAIRVVRQLLDAVRCLHEHGIVHRDIKPSNVISVGGVWKLADIGLLARETAQMTTVGTPDFMPPTGKIDRTVDLYALGKLLYCLVTGSPPRAFPTIPASVLAPDRRGATRENNSVITRACDIRPEARFHSPDEFDKALDGCLKRIKRSTGPAPLSRRMLLVGGVVAAPIVGLAAWWLVSSAAGLTQANAPGKAEAEWITLFNGHDLTGWYKGKPHHGTWFVEDGVIWCERDETYKTLLSEQEYGPGTIRATIIPGHDGARLGIGYLHDEQTRGPLFMFMGDKYTWIRGYREDYPPTEAGNWYSFPGPVLQANESAELQVEYGPNGVILRVNGSILYELSGASGEGHIALHVWSEDAGGFTDVAFLLTTLAGP